MANGCKDHAIRISRKLIRTYVCFFTVTREAESLPVTAYVFADFFHRCRVAFLEAFSQSTDNDQRSDTPSFCRDRFRVSLDGWATLAMAASILCFLFRPLVEGFCHVRLVCDMELRARIIERCSPNWSSSRSRGFRATWRSTLWSSILRQRRNFGLRYLAHSGSHRIRVHTLRWLQTGETVLRHHVFTIRSIVQ